jgi:hypothetical protein
MFLVSESLYVNISRKNGTQHLYLDEPHLRVYGTVGVFAKRIMEAIREDAEKPELWFVIVPDRVREYCLL